MDNIISFSLFGDNLKYWIGAVENIRLAKEYYPNFICRFYVREDSKKELIDTLIGENVEIFIESIDQNQYMTRFKAIDDGQIVLIRDCDSRISNREVIAVNEWIHSNKTFHIMRDHPAHIWPILAGMWGTNNWKKYKISMTDLITEWQSKPFNIDDAINWYCKYDKSGYVNITNNGYSSDQYFLDTILYSIIGSDVLEHSEFGHKFKNDIVPFNSKRDDYGFVGEVYDQYNNRNFFHHLDLIKNV